MHNSQLRREYPPRSGSECLHGDLSPLNAGRDGVPPIGVPPMSHRSSAFGESRGEILGPGAATFTGDAVSVHPLQSDSVVRTGPACHSIASQSDS